MSNMIVRISDSCAVTIGDRDLYIKRWGSLGYFSLEANKISDYEGLSDTITLWKGLYNDCLTLLDSILLKWQCGERFADLREVTSKFQEWTVRVYSAKIKSETQLDFAVVKVDPETKFSSLNNCTVIIVELKPEDEGSGFSNCLVVDGEHKDCCFLIDTEYLSFI